MNSLLLPVEVADPSMLVNVTVTFLSSVPTFSSAQTSRSAIPPLSSTTVYVVDIRPISTPTSKKEFRNNN